MNEQLKKKQSNPMGDRWIWFRYAFEEEKSTATKEEMHELIQLYLERHNEEIEQLEKDRNGRHKKQKSARQVMLESLAESEKSEYVSGMELPDMTNGKALKLLREWDGDKNSMTRIATIRLQKSDLEALNNSIMKTDTKETVTKEKSTKKDMMEL